MPEPPVPVVPPLPTPPPPVVPPVCVAPPVPVVPVPPVPVVPPVPAPPLPVIPPVLPPPTQVPLVHVAPAPQTVKLLPQWPGSLFELQAWSLLHIVLPDGHDDEH